MICADRCDDNRLRAGVWRWWHSPHFTRPRLVRVVSRSKVEGLVRVVEHVRVGAPVAHVPTAHLQPVTRADLPGTCSASEVCS